MTIHRNLNKNHIGGGNYAMWYLKETLKAAGWTVTRSGSGIGGSFATGDVFSGVANGDDWVAGLLGNGSCWFVLQDPGGNREYLWKRTAGVGNANDAYWGMVYSPSAGFTSGDEDTAATATDQEIVEAIGIVFNAGGTATLHHCAADDAPSSSGEYGFFLIEMDSINTTQAVCFVDDYKDAAPGDNHTIIMAMEDRPLSNTNWVVGYNAHGFSDFGGVGETWKIQGYAAFYSTGDAYSEWGGLSKYDSKERPTPLLVVDTTIDGWKGTSRWFLESGVARGYPETALSKTYLYVDQWLIADLWDGVSVPATV